MQNKDEVSSKQPNNYAYELLFVCYIYTQELKAVNNEFSSQTTPLQQKYG